MTGLIMPSTLFAVLINGNKIHLSCSDAEGFSVCLAPQHMLDVLEKGSNLRKVFKEFLDVTGMAPESSDIFGIHLLA